MGNAAETYGVAVGDEIAFSMSEPGGYLEEYEVRKLAASRTNERADYESDEAFANFRAITTTGIAPGRLYRSSSPINDELARAAFADALSKSAGITTVINLADSPEAVEGYFAQEGFSSEYYKSLYDSGKVITLDMGVDYSATDFQEKLAQGLRFIIENDGPYLIHCNEGKDRAGFTLMLLEAFTGAGIDEIKADHMLSFVNFYHLVPDSEQYQKTQTSNVVSLLENLTGAGVSVEQADLVASASEYLSAIGLTETEISELKAALTQ
jgi:protein tyrosine/serine phosphatase